jgi:hypothetical protein
MRRLNSKGEVVARGEYKELAKRLIRSDVQTRRSEAGETN